MLPEINSRSKEDEVNYRREVGKKAMRRELLKKKVAEKEKNRHKAEAT